MKLFIQCLSVVICAVLPLLSYSAVEEPNTKHQAEVSGVDRTMASSKQQKKDEKNLANEPHSRGQLLYENQCHSCHESVVHVRQDHKARNMADIQYWVGRWSQEVGTKWSADEIDAVVQYLNDTFYHY